MGLSHRGETHMRLIPDKYNPRAVEVASWLRQRLDPSRLREDLHVVLGGDGFMLKTIAASAHASPLFLGLNCGRVGFLLNDLPDDLGELPDLLYEGLHAIQFPRIEMKAVAASGEVTALAVNDIYLERQTGQTAHLSVWINGSHIVERLVADGLICSTALGSTAYSVSAGASACHPTLQVMVVTPICPHSPALRPLVVPLGANVRIEVLSPERRPVRAVADGQEWADVTSVTIQDAHDPVSLAFFPGHDFTRALVRKLLI